MLMFAVVVAACATEMWEIVGIKLGIEKFKVFGAVGSILRRLFGVPGTGTWVEGAFYGGVGGWVRLRWVLNGGGDD